MMRVAIVDDDPIVCSSLSTILKATGTADIAWTVLPRRERSSTPIRMRKS